jgi:hypothetical protein
MSAVGDWARKGKEKLRTAATHGKKTATAMYQIIASLSGEKSLPVERNDGRESTTEGRKRDLISKEELNSLEHGNTTGTFGRFTTPLSGQTMYCL